MHCLLHPLTSAGPNSLSCPACWGSQPAGANSILFGFMVCSVCCMYRCAHSNDSLAMPQVLPALQMLRDPEYLNSVLGSLPGVNPNDPALQSALQNLHDSSKGAEDKGKSDKKDDSK